MARFCGKCGTPLDRNGKCLRCDCEQKQEKKWKNKTQRKNEIKQHRRGKGMQAVLIVILCAMLICFGILVLQYFGVIKFDYAEHFLKRIGLTQQNESIAALNKECVKIVQSNVKMSSDTEGIAQYEVTIPDYEKLFQMAIQESSHDPEQYVEQILSSGNFPVQVCKMEAPVQIVNGQMQEDTDQTLKELLTGKLNAAVDAVLQEGTGK